MFQQNFLTVNFLLKIFKKFEGRGKALPIGKTYNKVTPLLEQISPNFKRLDLPVIPTMEEGSEETGKGDMPMKLRE